MLQVDGIKDGKPFGHNEYSFDPIANEMMAKPRTPIEMRNAVVAGIKKWQKGILLATPPSERSNRAGDQNALVASIFWFDGSKLMMQNIRAVPVVDTGEIYSKVTPSEPIEIPDHGFVSPPGARKKAPTDPNTQHKIAPLTDPAAVVNTLLGAESELSKDVVGPPFTIFRLSRGGGEWLSRDGTAMCKTNSHLAIRH
jgi:hypothetical protein